MLELEEFLVLLDGTCFTTIKGFVTPDPDLTQATAASDYQLIFLPKAESEKRQSAAFVWSIIFIRAMITLHGC